MACLTGIPGTAVNNRWGDSIGDRFAFFGKHYKNTVVVNSITPICSVIPLSPAWRSKNQFMESHL